MLNMIKKLFGVHSEPAAPARFAATPTISEHKQKPSEALDLCGLTYEIAGNVGNYALAITGTAMVNGQVISFADLVPINDQGGAIFIDGSGNLVSSSATAFALLAWWGAEGVVGVVKHE